MALGRMPVATKNSILYHFTQLTDRIDTENDTSVKLAGLYFRYRTVGIAGDKSAGVITQKGTLCL